MRIHDLKNIILKRKRRIIFSILIGTIIVFTFTIWANANIKLTTEKFIEGEIDKVANAKVGLLLGTSKSLSDGSRNDFFYNRIDAAVELFYKNKIKYILVSGDNGNHYYNEPLDMKTELIQRGIPEEKIILDFAGFRTYDYVIRAKEIFGQTSFIIISQKFHNERAIYIARKNGIEAFGYNAKEVGEYKGFKTKLREYVARDKMFIDFLLNVKPKFLGEKIVID